jgi:DNA-binding transcriptional ArsR family regulator
VFAAIGDPTRRKVLDLLSSRQLAAGEIASQFHFSRPAISQHLHVLRRAKLVAVRKKGREQIYRLNPEPLREVYDWIEHYQEFWNSKVAALGDYLDRISGGRK